MLDSAEKLDSAADFILQKGLVVAHTAKNNNACFSHHGFTVIGQQSGLS